MKYFSLIWMALAAATSWTVKADDGHDHEGHDHEHEHHPCACEAAEYGFEIDCTDTQAMLDALPILQSSGCANDCSSDECIKNFLIIQSHHDFCLHDEVPETVEDALHLYEDTCESCEIKRKFDPLLQPCPEPNCDDNSGNEAYNAISSANCETDCASCASSFRMLKAVHDECEGEVLDTSAELAFHEIEVACEQYNCNVFTSAEGSTAQLICDESEESGATTVSAVLASMPLIALALAM